MKQMHKHAAQVEVLSTSVASGVWGLGFIGFGAGVSLTFYLGASENQAN